MFPRVKFPFSSSFCNSLHLCVFIYVLVIVCFDNLCLSETCRHVTDCKCVFNNGSTIDLSNVQGLDNKPVWENVKSIPPSNYTYSYNPCHKFTLGGECKDVEVCQKSNKGEYFNAGSLAHPEWNDSNDTLTIIYTTPTGRKTIVKLVCSPNAWISMLEVQGEISKSTYEMTLTSRCACADLCNERHMSSGSVLVIIFLIFVFLYLILGIIHSSLTRGAHGWELIPHYEFWMDFPLLVRDGCVFVMSGCKAETAYERI